MVKWWLACVCSERDVANNHVDVASREVVWNPSPASIMTLTPPPPAAGPDLFGDINIHELQSFLKEIDKAIDKVRQRMGRLEAIPSSAIINFRDADTIVNGVAAFFQNINCETPISKVGSESYHVLRELLQGLGNLHWAAAGLSLVAFVLNRIDQVGANTAECLSLLEAMRDLGKHVIDLYPQLSEDNDKLRHATCLITEGTVICLMHMDSGVFNRFCFTSVSKDNFDLLRKKITQLYPDLILTVNEAILAQTAILLRQSSMPLSPLKPEYPTNKVGLDERVHAVLRILGMQDMQEPDPGVKAVVLHGMGGIGKSTLGMALHAKLPFIGRAHAKVEVGECPTKEKIRECQKDILVRLSGYKISIADRSEGRQKLGMYLQDCTEPILLFIDNIFKGEDLDELLPEKLVFPDGSRIILTSRDASVCAVLSEKGVNCEPYPVAELGQSQARKLLCMQVFSGLHPPPNREEQVSDLLNICGGLPLALEVVGRYLRRHKSDKAWTQAIESLKKCHPVSGKKEDQLYQSLLFSYNQLAEEYQKAFVDITCMFWDTPWDWVEPIYGQKLVTLEELALVKKVDCGDGFVRLQVHDLLVALGRSLQHGTLIFSDGQQMLPSLLQEHSPGIEGIFVRNCTEPILAEKLDAVHKSLRILILQDVPVLGKCCKNPQGLQLCISTNGLPYKDLANLNELQVLIMYYETDFDVETVKFPRNLKVLILFEVRTLVSLPAAFGELKSLHTLDISWCQTVQELPETFGQLHCLHTLNLTGCRRLEKLPRDFEYLISLQILDLCYCEQLQELPSGFGQLNALQKLNLCGCKSLKKLPDDFSQLSALQVLHLGECESLVTLPEHFGHLGCLQDLNLTRCNSLEELPEGFAMLSALQTLSLEHCHKLSILPAQFGQLSSLVTLRLSNCHRIREIPISFLQLRHLRSLDVSGCPIENKTVLEELTQQQECRVVCEDIDLDDSGYFEYTESVPSVFYESTDLDEQEFGDLSMVELQHNGII